MKKFGCMKVFVIMVAVMTVFMTMLFYFGNMLLDRMFEDKVLSELPDYNDSVSFESEDPTDYVNYTKYMFSEDANGKVDDSSYLKRVTSEDMKEIREHVADFEKWIEKKQYDGYDFTQDRIDDSDYFYLENKETFEGYENFPEKLSVYTIYFFDSQSRILYYMHYNI